MLRSIRDAAQPGKLPMTAATHRDRLSACVTVGLTGRVGRVSGAGLAVLDFPATLGAQVRVRPSAGPPLDGEVTGFRDRETFVMPLGEPGGVRRGDPVSLVRTRAALAAGPRLLGRVLDGSGRAIDGVCEPPRPWRCDPHAAPPPALSRAAVTEPLATGVRVVDGLLTLGRGQRVGLFAGSGVGKSTLLGQIARGTAADVVVVVLVGERGREVRAFLDEDLGEEGRRRGVMVVSTSDEPAAARLRAVRTGTALAEAFRDRGRDVLLLVDSLTRTAHAAREVGLASGEPPAARGYPPSVFSLLPKLLERSGPGPDGPDDGGKRGSITAIYTVLTEGEDRDDPIADAVRGTLDGHVWLSRTLAERGHWPAVDVPASLSRLMPDVTKPAHLSAAAAVRRTLAARAAADDLLAIGAYRPGADVDVDRALRDAAALEAFLHQRPEELVPFDETVSRLGRLLTPFIPPPAAGQNRGEQREAAS